MAVETQTATLSPAVQPSGKSLGRRPGPVSRVASQASRNRRPDRHPVVDIVVPVFNEERALEQSIRRLRSYLDLRFPFVARITIADNASSDSTWAIARRLEQVLTGVRAIHLDQKGRGRALRAAWLASDAAVFAYMDVDLSTDLDALLPLVASIVSGHSEVAIGSRLAPGARVTRGPRRELISRGYNLILQAALGARFRDAQCGFKAIRFDVAQRLLPLVEDEAWFFDTELLVLAQRAGLRIHEVPVDWVDDPDSRVDIPATALADLRGVWRLMRRGPSLSVPASRPSSLGQIRRFAAIGILSTLAYAGLYALLRVALPASGANALALVATAVANTAANRRWTFGVRDHESLGRHHLAGLTALAVALAITSGAVGLLGAAVPQPARALELAVLIGANALATIVRFVLLRSWIARGSRPSPAPLQFERIRS